MHLEYAMRPKKLKINAMHTDPQKIWHETEK